MIHDRVSQTVETFRWNGSLQEAPEDKTTGRGKCPDVMHTSQQHIIGLNENGKTFGWERRETSHRDVSTEYSRAKESRVKG